MEFYDLYQVTMCPRERAYPDQSGRSVWVALPRSSRDEVTTIAGSRHRAALEDAARCVGYEMEAVDVTYQGEVAIGK